MRVIDHHLRPITRTFIGHHLDRKSIGPHKRFDFAQRIGIDMHLEIDTFVKLTVKHIAVAAFVAQ